MLDLARCLETKLARLLFEKDEVIELEFQGEKKKFTMLQVKFCRTY